MKSLMKYILLFCFSGYVYVCLELLFRQRSDITMMFCASLCCIPMILLNNKFTYDIDFLLQILICTVFCTGIEWIFGILFNQDFHIWDYRNMPFASPDYQVCLPFSLVWGAISAVTIPLMDYIDYKVFNYMPDTPPYYKIFGKTFHMKGGKRHG